MPKKTNTYESLNAYREKVVTPLLWLCIALGSFAVLLTVRTSNDLLNVSLLLYILLVLAAIFFRKSFSIRAGMLIFVLYGISIDSFYSFGMISASRMVAVLFVVLAGVLLGVRTAIAAMLLYLVTMTICANQILSGRWTLPPEVRGYSSVPMNWVQHGLTFLVVAGAVLYAVLFLIQSLDSQIQRLRVESDEKNEALKAEQFSQHRYALLAENVDDFIWTADLTANFTYCSPSITGLLGYTAEELLGTNSMDMAAPEWVEYLIEALQDENRLEEEGAPIDRHRILKLQLRKKDETLLWVEANVSFLRDSDNIPIGIVGSSRDISDRVKAEEEKETLEEQTRQLQKLEAMGRLAGGVAHDLNNLLTPILGYSDMMEGTFDENDERAEYVEQITGAATSGREIVHQLLSFGRKQSLTYTPLDINQVIQRVEKLIQGGLSDDIEFHFFPAVDLPGVVGDSSQIEQVLMNLIMNAKDAMTGGDSLTLETSFVDAEDSTEFNHTSPTPGKWVSITVSDTGCGMDQATQSQMFEPFFSTKGDGGTGLGLASVFGIVKQHGGSIEVESAAGSGTSIRVLLPASDKEVSADNASESPDVSLDGTGVILLVEDEESIRKLVEPFLSQLGYTILSAKDGPEALDVLANEKIDIDLLLTDVVMPKMSGKELYTRVKEITPNAKTIFMSGYAPEDLDLQHALDEQIPFIQKPFKIADLARKIHEQLS